MHVKKTLKRKIKTNKRLLGGIPCRKPPWSHNKPEHWTSEHPHLSAHDHSHPVATRSLATVKLLAAGFLHRRLEIYLTCKGLRSASKWAWSLNYSWVKNNLGLLISNKYMGGGKVKGHFTGKYLKHFQYPTMHCSL